MWTVASSAVRAAAESGVAGLGSEAMATLCVEWLEPLLERFDSVESSFAKPAALSRHRHRLTLRALRGCCRASLADICTGPRQSSSFARHYHAGLEPVLRKLMFLQPNMFWTNRPELRLLVRDVA